ncbi:MAG: Na+/H+ antiporter NhaA, partial [Pirellula sp.]
MAHKPPRESTDKIPVPKVAQWLVPVKRFLHIEATSGVVLMLCTLIALVIANSPWDEAFEKFWNTHVAFEFGKLKID